MRGVAVDPVGAARRDHADRRRRVARIAHLHRRGVRCAAAGACPAHPRVDVERVLHRARRMVLRVVERSEVVPVVLDLGAVGDVETRSRRRSPRRASRCAGSDGCRRAPRIAARQADVDRLGGQPPLQLDVAPARRGARCSAASMRCLAALMRAPSLRFSSGEQLRQALEQFGEAAALAQEARFLVFERGRRRRRGKGPLRVGDQGIERIHRGSAGRERQAGAPTATGAAAPVANAAAQPGGRCKVARGQVGLDLLDDRGESRLVEHRHVGQDLAVDLDRGLPQAIHEHAVRHAVLARRRVDARDPQRAEHALLGAAVAVGVLPGVHDRFLGDAKDVVAPPRKPLAS